MDIPHEIALMEQCLAACEIPVGELVSTAGIDSSTWSRWRRGLTLPRVDRWIAVKSVCDALTTANTSQPSSLTVLFERLGGLSAVAKLLGVQHSTVLEMTRRHSIPLRYWPPLIRASRQVGLRLTEAKLLRLHLRRTAPIKMEAAE